MKRISNKLQKNAKLLAILLVGAAYVAVLLLLHLSSLVEGISGRELAFYEQYASLSAIAHNPVYLPLTVVSWLVGLIPVGGELWLRLPSVVFAALSIASVTYVLRRWYGPRTAVFGFLLFTASAWVLHVGRLATEDVIYLWAIPTLLVAHLLLHDYTSNRFVLFLFTAVQITMLYIPGMFWFVLLNGFWQRSEILEALRALRSWLGKAALLVFKLVLLAPLVIGLLVGNSKVVALTLFGLPNSLPSLSELGNNLLDALLFISIRGNAPTDVWLNHLPLLDAFLTIALLMGIYFYAKHLRATRTLLLASFILVWLVLLTVGGPVTVGLIVPLLYFVAAGGIAYLLHLWLAVFPRNPLARGAGIAVVSIAILTSSLYGLRQYFVAWQHHPDTQNSFETRELPPKTTINLLQ